MKNYGLVAVFLIGIGAQAAPYTPDQLQLRTTVKPHADLGIAASSMYNPRFFDGSIYVSQINTLAIGRYRSGGTRPSMVLDNTPAAWEHRMLAPFRGANSATYLLAAGGANNFTFSRYDANGENRVDADVSGGETAAESFDWVDENTIIYVIYNPSGSRKRLALAHVEAEPFEVMPDTRWNPDGYITTSATTRLRNVRVGDVYSGYAYYGDAGSNENPKFYAVDLATGAETLLGNAGTLTGSGSFGLWTVVERDGYLYVQTTDNGIQVYNMNSATSLGSLYATYTKEKLDAITGNTGQYYGFDVSPDGTKLLLGDGQGSVFELGPPLPVQLVITVNPSADLGIGGSSMYNPRFFDDDIYASQINTPLFGRYPVGTNVPSLLMDNTAEPLEHRMTAAFRGANRTKYILGAGGANNTLFSRYDFNGENRVDVPAPGGEVAVESFDWVDDSTIIYVTYNPSANRNRLSLARVQAEPFAVTPDTRWNGNGFVTTSATTRLRNVRVGDVYGGFAYYGDAGLNDNPSFYAINLATGAETLLGKAGTLTGSGSFGLWTAVERGGYLYVQTTDNGIQVYKMDSATSLGALQTTYAKEDIDAATGYTGQYWGFDIAPDRLSLILGGGGGTVYQLKARLEEPSEPLVLSIARSGADIILSWPASVTGAAIQSSTQIAPASFADLNPQPAVTVVQEMNQATLTPSASAGFYRLRK